MFDTYVFGMLGAIGALLVAAWLGLSLVLSRGARDQMVGQLAAYVVRFVFLFPVKVIRWLARVIGLRP